MSNGFETGSSQEFQETIDLLRVHASTCGLDDQQVVQLATHARVVRIREGEFVHRSGEPTLALHLVVVGRLRIVAVLPGGGERIIQRLGRDDQIGLLALSSAEVLAVNIVAEQNSILLRFPRDAAQQLFDDLRPWRQNLLGSLGPRIRESLIDGKRHKNPRIVGLVHTTSESHAVTPQLVGRLSELQERVGLLSDDSKILRSVKGPVSSLLDAQGVPKSWEQIRRIVGQWSDLDRVIVDVHTDRDPRELVALSEACDQVFWTCSSATHGRVVEELTPILESSPGRRDKTFLIWLLEAREQVAPFVPELTALCKRDFKLHWNGWRDSPACSRRIGMERIVHHLRGVSIGLALGGGAARGMAHLGVLQVLDDLGIPVDRIAGTSAGALTGIPYAAGYTPAFQVKSFTRDLTPAWYFRLLPYGETWYMVNKYRSGGWDPMLREYLHRWRLEQLPIPCSAVAADLVQARQVVRDRGDAVDALLESINLPVISQPICRGGMALVDGGILNVLPADVLASQESNIVIAVDVSASMVTEFAGNGPNTPADGMNVPSTAQTFWRMRLVQDHNIRAIGVGAVDVIIEPDVSEVDMADFAKTTEIAGLGQTATEGSSSELQNALNRIDPQLFPEPPTADPGEETLGEFADPLRLAG